MLAAEVHTCVGCHRPHTEKAAAVACSTCHSKTQVTHPKSAEGQQCIGCHPPHAATVTTALALPCITCHAGAPFNAPVVHASSVTCSSCHQSHIGKAAPTVCKQCHQEQLAKTSLNKGHVNCVACHAGLPHDTTVPVKPCLTCHEDKKPPQKGHTQCATCHEDHSARVTMKSCTQCHDAKKLPGLHLVDQHAASCTSCHAPHLPQPGFGPASCLTCHKSLPKENHPTPPKQCVSCHLFKKP
jgi:hypothetical protein